MKNKQNKKEVERVSNCCQARVDNGRCSDCKENCDTETIILEDLTLEEKIKFALSLDTKIICLSKELRKTENQLSAIVSNFTEFEKNIYFKKAAKQYAKSIIDRTN